MLIEFRTANFRSIRDEQMLSFVAGSGKDLENPLHRFETEEAKPQKLVKAICLYGANASGKSNLLQALRVMVRLIRQSNQMQAGDSLKDMEPFLFSPETADEPCTFEMTLIVPIDGRQTRVQYGFKADKKKIHEEWLYTFPKRYARTLLYRESDWSEKEWDGTAVKGIYKQVAMRTNSNTLFLSKAGGSENHPTLEPIYSWIKEKFLFMNTSTDSIDKFLGFSKKKFLDDDHFSGFAKDLLRRAGTGIVDASIEKEDVQLQLPEEIPIEIRTKIIQEFQNAKGLSLKTYHAPKPDQKYPLRLRDESLGTQRLFMLSGPIHEALTRGALLVIDELEASMHPLLTRALMELFHHAPTQQPAQIIFSTHQTHLLDSQYLSRDQVWFTEKDAAGATHLYSLWDFKVRKDRVLEKGYMSGVFGAVPHLEEFVYGTP